MCFHCVKIYREVLPAKYLWTANFFSRVVCKHWSLWFYKSHWVLFRVLLHIIFVSNLKTVSSNKIACKYANDTTSIVAESSDVNGLYVINRSLTLVEPRNLIYMPWLNINILLAVGTDVIRSTELKFLGIVITSTLCFQQHTDSVFHVYSKRFNLLNKHNQCSS